MWKLMNYLFGWQYIVHKSPKGYKNYEWVDRKVYKDDNGNYYVLDGNNYIFLDQINPSEYRWLTKEPEDVRSTNTNS